jgi:hypothetical protein
MRCIRPLFILAVATTLAHSTSAYAQGSDGNRPILDPGTCPLAQGFTRITELYNTLLKHFFYTTPCFGDELTGIRAGEAGPGWVTTGRQYRVPIKYGGPNMCRFYGSLSPGPNSHLYVYDDECAEVKRLESILPSTVPRWNSENYGVGWQPIGLTPTGACIVSALVPAPVRLIRLFNDGPRRGRDSNHRFLPDYATSEIAQLVSDGWINEGPNFCVNSAFKDGLLER